MGQHFQRGQILFDLKRYRDAIEAYQLELAANPDAAVVYAVMAAAFINLGNVRDADGSIRRALELAPDMAYAHYILSFIHQRRQSLGLAEKAIAEAVRLEQSPEMFHQWATIAEQRGKFSEALAATGHALQLNPHHTPSILLRGKLLAAEGKLDEAHRLYATALSVSPEDPSAHLALGSFRLRTGNAAEALDLLREARRLDPINANDVAAIALAYGRMIWPLNIADRLIFRWNNLSPTKLWCLFAFLAIILAIGGRLAGSNLVRMMPPPIWLIGCIVAANYLMLPFTFDQLAAAVGRIALRREFGRSWTSLLVNPFIVIPVAGMHAGATAIGFLAAFPGLAVILCYGGASFSIVRESIKSGAGRLVGYICVPLYVLQLVICAFAAIIFDLSATNGFGSGDREIAAIAIVLLPIMFVLSILNLPLARAISWWQSRRHPLLTAVT